MNIRLHNTLSRQKEVFVPADPQRVTMYVCGPTVYNYVHIGNARPVVVFDVLSRLLSRHFPQVVYARNITDVDDKVNAAAAANGEPIRMLTERFADASRQDMARLNALPPTLELWATEHVPQMIALIERGHAYVRDGADLLGLLQQPPARWRQQGGMPADKQAAGPTPESIESMIAARQAARAARDFARADALRQTLAAQGIGIEDSPTGTTWHRLHTEHMP
ncbi:MAG: hypothetical protein HWD57_17435 [Candidatus Accumulibacter cognatus]|uniref:Cysteine--tRNA ligase n=1 Tax=Candidatus Accumulibacter cognatus TaxID=2954383 RepID=A0A080M4L2_9PROT|nr:MAG: Cysteine--tRNA ligase [Candidatus Accumulibacter cognatus]QLH51388.1 MAG: hypothetical protein HWD57_17435 [Candidatus Accumulibacter cognatus]